MDTLFWLQSCLANLRGLVEVRTETGQLRFAGLQKC
uniref:Uncharacterized protein n=1 Tax=Anguilla anguilla TaxID=7936 RepID=A0A0E9U0F8_ANGAN